MAQDRLREKLSFSERVIEEAYRRFNKLALTWSGGKDSTAMLHMVLKVVEKNGWEQPLVLASDPIPIPENDEFIRRAAKELGVKRIIFYRDLLRREDFQAAGEPGKDKVRCCQALKIEPLKRFIRDYRIDGLFVAIRWDEHPERAKEKHFSPRENPPHTRIHPILHWRWHEVWEYIKQFKVPVNPLYFRGYTSLGCAPCTKPVKPDGFKSIDEIIEWARRRVLPERAGRDIDKELVMERLRGLGYF